MGSGPWAEELSILCKGREGWGMYNRDLVKVFLCHGCARILTDFEKKIREICGKKNRSFGSSKAEASLCLNIKNPRAYPDGSPLAR
jgi:hypothetical protein